MAIVWGSYIRGWRVGVEFTVTHTYASNTQTVRADFYFQGNSGYNINDSNNSFSASFAGGSLSGSRSVYLTSSGGTVHLGSITRTCYSAYGSTTAFPASMTISGLEAVGGTLSASATHTVPRRPYSQPPAPSNLAATRSGTSASVSWKNNHSTSSSAETYASGIRVTGYYQGADGSSIHVFSVDLANTATSYTRTGLNTTQAVTMGVHVLNSDGASEAWTGWRYPTPSAPTGCTSTRNSDTSNTVSWANTAPNYPSTNVLIESSANGGAFVQIASVGGTATSYTHSGTAANNSYRYRVRTRYGDKYSGYSTSGYTYNTPAKPSNVRAAKNADNSVTVSWVDNARTETGFSLQRSQDGGATWVTVTSSIAANTTSYRDTAAPGGSLTYRMEAHRHPLYSGWSASSPSITTIAPPLAPTISQRPDTYIEHGQSVRLGWVHNPVDGSGMTAFEVLVDEGLPSQRVISGVSSSSIYIGSGEPGAHTLKVRTKGAHANWSPYSQTVTYTVAIPPQVIITAPATDGEVITALPATTAWTTTDPAYSIIDHTYTITDESGRTAFSVRNPEGSELTLDASTWMPSNGETYTLTVTARASSGLTASASRAFEVAYVPPIEPVVEITTDSDRLSVQVQISDGEPEDGRVMPETYTVIRITDAGETVLATDLISGGVVDDLTPPLNVTFSYRVASHAASGEISEVETAHIVHTNGEHVINYGDGFAKLQRIRWNLKVDSEVEKEQELHEYEGRKYPVLYHGNRRRHRIGISGQLKRWEDISGWYDLGDWAGACVLRTANGQVYVVSESHRIETSHDSGPMIVVSMEVIDHELV